MSSGLRRTVYELFQRQQSDTRERGAAPPMCRCTTAPYFASEAEKDALRELGVEEYEIIGTLDSTTCALCGSMDGEKGRVSDFSASVSVPLFHPMCRCTTVPYFADDTDGELIARDKDGEIYYVPEDMKYEDWNEKYMQINLLKLSASQSGHTSSGSGKINISDANTLDELKKLAKGMGRD